MQSVLPHRHGLVTADLALTKLCEVEAGPDCREITTQTHGMVAAKLAQTTLIE